MADLVTRVRVIREKTWDREPEDVRQLLDPSVGFTDTWKSTFFPTLYAWEETIATRNVFFVLRESIRAGGLDLATVKRLTANLVAMYVPFVKWANLSETAELFQTVAAEVPQLADEAELMALLEELVMYIGRLHYWLEPLMPWNEMVDAFNRATGAAQG